MFRQINDLRVTEHQRNGQFEFFLQIGCFERKRIVFTRVDQVGDIKAVPAFFIFGLKDPFGCIFAVTEIK